MGASLPDTPEVTYVTGYWMLPKNAKYPIEHYQEQIPQSMKMIAKRKLVLYYDDPRTEAMFAEACRPLDIRLHPKRVSVEALPAYRHANALVECCRSMQWEEFDRAPLRGSEKGLIHHRRDLMGSGEEIYRKLITIWMSKVALTSQVASEGRDATYFAWMDASIARFNGLRTNWNFPVQAFAAEALNHYASSMTYRGERLPLNASFMLGTPAVWAAVNRAFDARLEASLSDAYAHDEETVLGLVHRERPELFHTIGVSFPQVGRKPNAGRRLVRTLRRRLGGMRPWGARP
jgi:hypothetical protein